MKVKNINYTPVFNSDLLNLNFCEYNHGKEICVTFLYEFKMGRNVVSRNYTKY